MLNLDSEDFQWVVLYIDDVNYHTIDKWCSRTIGIKSEDWTYGASGWRFKSEEDAMLFELTWG